MKPKLITISDKKLIGLKSSMHHGEFGNIVALWKRFMPRKKEILGCLNSELIAVQAYDDFNAIEKPFDIWACVEVSSLEHIPEGMTSLTIPESDYAVFVHKGMDAAGTYQKIMTEWLPTSGYDIDNRIHFQVMGAKYINGSMESEEDFYVPVKN
ncbi:GyrI-like domain-containing protein [uncultured Winogradskyella sp.]|uniref:GyrI-like domain-containing protein n=1 Tax=uncultured Winogradskyella sp. TaxID=395353 RepID=UPI0030ECF730|tara:strand:+ start:408 stop:869 length:462 start_codon:yes stop_codon:yes gene_type:complete